VTVKAFIMLQNVYISNKCYHFQLSINQRILHLFIAVSTKILSSTTVFNINDNNNNKCIKRIRMISEGSWQIKYSYFK